MSFLVLILTILLEKLSHWRQMLQKDQWWYEQLQRCHKLLSKQHTLALLLALSLPLIALALVLVSLKSVAYGLLLLPVHLIVLMYSLSRRAQLVRQSRVGAMREKGEKQAKGPGVNAKTAALIEPAIGLDCDRASGFSGTACGRARPQSRSTPSAQKPR